MRRIALLLLVLPALACASSPGAEVRTAMAGFMRALNDVDADRITSFFADDATAFFPTVKAERLDGREAIAAVFRDYAAANPKKTNIVPEDLLVTQEGDLAVVTFNVRNPSAVSRRTFVWRRQAGTWRIVHLHASNSRN